MKEFDDNILRPKEKNTKWYVWLFVALLGALLLSNLAGETIKNMFFSLLAGLTPIIVALILSFVLLHPVRWIEDKMLKNAFVGNPKAKAYKRMISLSILYGIIIGIIIVLLVTMVPNLVQTLRELAADSEHIIGDLKAQITNLVVSITGLPAAEVESALSNFIQQLTDWVRDFFNSLSTNLTNIVSVVGNVLFVIFMSLVLSFLILKDKELIANTARRYTYAYSAKRKADEIIMTTKRTKKVLDQWLVCNLIQMAVIFVVALIGYIIIGIRFPIMLALCLAILSVVPYIGGFIAMIPVVMVCLFFGTTSQLLAAVIFGIASWAIIVTFLPPFIMSSRLKTRAVVLIFIMIIAGAMFGLWGMILSGPIAAMLNIWMQERLEVREAMREREEMLESGAEISLTSVGDILDLREDVDTTLLDSIEDEKKRLKTKTKEKPKEEKDQKQKNQEKINNYKKDIR